VKLIHDPAQLTAFVTFAAVVAGTPGPSNALLTATGARVGVRKGLASLLGQVTGMGAMLVALPSCLPWLAFGAVLQHFLEGPRARRVLNIVMAALLAGSTILLVWTGF
jgi:threonine/homoserine/homoserine lactone efflux protein